ncbi:beta-glucuronidase [Nesidiocoris tenuis]|uniref:Beta-glucuronidase n=1 Tax=Nesidiocoris tenuis TaxID=355587 RepID=A0ABN7ATV5_9HEMI|nr:beta-glucuronidase [Nesidiocoris tenuis]
MLIAIWSLIFLTGIVECEISTRFEFSLNGIWKFRLPPPDQPNKGFDEEWWNSDFRYESDAIDMPVPSSFNDITTDHDVRDFVGWVWYQRIVQLPKLPQPRASVLLHFGSAEYYTQAWINDFKTHDHIGGHIPFYLDITEPAKNSSDGSFRLTVAVNNTLSDKTLPQGSLKFETDTDGYQYKTYTHDFDYFDYAGLNGKVRVEIAPHPRIYGVEIRSVGYDKLTDRGSATFRVDFGPPQLSDPACRYTVSDWRGKEVFDSRRKECPFSDNEDVVLIDSPDLWWPRESFNQSRTPGRLYTLHVHLYEGENIWDVVSVNFGIRTISSTPSSILINGEPAYLKGFGMHQDAELRGRGFDAVQLTRDINLLKWTGANAIRTSHYPYTEEFLDMADRYGFMVILETPACSLSNFDTLLGRHMKVFAEMYYAFGHHPSVIMWSMANEPLSNNPNSTAYFKSLVDFAREFDTTRLFTFVTSQQILNEKAIQAMDVICLNRYEGWYSLGGRLDLVEHRIGRELSQWQAKYQKPVILTEYGAEALSGYHSLPSTMWTENYQIELLKEHFKAFDSLRQDDALAGEMLWNFADFKVPQEYFRAEYCNKGIFTRNRQPKGAAYTIKSRYTSLVSIDRPTTVGPQENQSYTITTV